MKIAIVDYGMGNLRSVFKAIFKIGETPIITSNPSEILKSDKIILPGVGHFKQGMDNIKNLNLYDSLREYAEIKKKPILGICLGMQLMANYSEEGNEKGFAWIDADVVRFNVSDIIKYKVPHMGWNTLVYNKNELVCRGIACEDEFYFVHSYHFQNTEKSQILAKTNYDYEFVSAIKKDNIIGFQFHPEKSHDVGRILLKNFLYNYV